MHLYGDCTLVAVNCDLHGVDKKTQSRVKQQKLPCQMG